MDKRYISLDAIVKDITEGKIEVTGDPYAQKCVEAYRDVILKRLAAEPTITVTTVNAVYEVDRAFAPAEITDDAALAAHVTANLLDHLMEALRSHVIIEREPDLPRGKIIFRAIIKAVRPGA